VFLLVLCSFFTIRTSLSIPNNTSNFGDFPFKLGDYYDLDLIEELVDQGIDIYKLNLIAITKNQEDSIIWLDQGTSTRGFDHILQRHSDDFGEYFNVYDPQSIGNFIFDAIKRQQIYRSYPGAYPGSMLYVYRFGANYLKLIVTYDGSIITAYPSHTDYF